MEKPKRGLIVSIAIGMVCLLGIIVIPLAFSGGDVQGEKEHSFVIEEPSDDDVNGYRLDSVDDAAESDSHIQSSTDAARYYANIKTKKFHCCDCAYAQKIKNENLYITSDRNELIEQGYSPCANCNP